MSRPFASYRIMHPLRCRIGDRSIVNMRSRDPASILCVKIDCTNSLFGAVPSRAKYTNHQWILAGHNICFVIMHTKPQGCLCLHGSRENLSRCQTQSRIHTKGVFTTQDDYHEG